jgi:hypothetical protein
MFGYPARSAGILRGVASEPFPCAIFSQNATLDPQMVPIRHLSLKVIAALTSRHARLCHPAVGSGWLPYEDDPHAEADYEEQCSRPEHDLWPRNLAVILGGRLSPAAA